MLPYINHPNPMNGQIKTEFGKGQGIMWSQLIIIHHV